MEVVSYGQFTWFEFAIYQFLDALFTGVMVAAVIAFTIRFLRVRGVTFKVDVDGRDQDRSD